MKRFYLSALLVTLLASCGETPSASSSAGGGSAESYDIEEATGSVLSYTGTQDAEASYEIFVYSFADSDGDGVGDLKGIEDKLDYLGELGVKNIWLTPIHPSSTYHKYNVKDYFSIDPQFGTVADFVSLTTKAKEKGLNILMDMVFNHSGIDNPWFAQAAFDFVSENSSDDSLKDLYVFSWDGKDISNTKAMYNVEGIDIYYECNFDRSMPEFNLESDIARAKHKEIMDFWLDKGASGFRFDGVAYYHLGNNAKCMEYCKYLADTARATKSDAKLIGEFWVNDQPTINTIAPTGMTGFNFPTSTSGVSTNPIFAMRSGNGGRFARAVADASQGFLSGSNGKTLPSHFLTNHDQDRWAGSLADEQIKFAASAYLLTSGTPYIYYGEEIKMQGIRQTAQTDINRRLPMQWKSNANEDTARCKVGPGSDYSGKQTTLGGLEAIKDTSSVTYYYKELLAFRNRTEAIKKGYYRNVTPSDSPLIAFQIDYQGKTSYLIHNAESEEVKVHLPKDMALVTAPGSDKAGLRGKELTLDAYGFAYLTTQNA